MILGAQIYDLCIQLHGLGPKILDADPNPVILAQIEDLGAYTSKVVAPTSRFVILLLSVCQDCSQAKVRDSDERVRVG